VPACCSVPGPPAELVGRNRQHRIAFSFGRETAGVDQQRRLAGTRAPQAVPGVPGDAYVGAGPLVVAQSWPLEDRLQAAAEMVSTGTAFLPTRWGSGGPLLAVQGLDASAATPRRPVGPAVDKTREGVEVHRGQPSSRWEKRPSESPSRTHRSMALLSSVRRGATRNGKVAMELGRHGRDRHGRTVWHAQPIGTARRKTVSRKAPRR